MYRGYVKLWRKSFESIIWKSPKLWRFWTWCLMKATHTDYDANIDYNKVSLKPGQFLFGRKKCSQETGLSEQTIRTCIQKLNGEKLTVETTNKYSKATIINWETYQQTEKEINQENNQQVTSKQPASNQQVTTYKNVKNNKNVKNDKIIYSRIVSYLNQKTGKNFKATTKNTKSFINARLSEGFTEQNFYTVIDNKYKSWLSDAKMREFLRPQTLFGTKFESYLQDKPHPLKGKISDKGIENVELLKKWRPPNE